MTRDLPPVESVRGGTHGVVAGYAQMEALAARCRDRAGVMSEMALLGPKVVADDDLLASSVFSPSTCVRAQAQVLDATTGVHGLTLRALDLEADGVLVKAVLSGFRAADGLAQVMAREGASLLARTAVRGLGPLVLLPGTGLYAATLAFTRDDLPVRLGAAAHDHPALAQHLVAAGGGLLAALAPPGTDRWLAGQSQDGAVQPTVQDAAALLARVAGDRADAVVVRADVPGPDEDLPVPGSLRDLVDNLGRTAVLDAHDPDLEGAVQIQEVVTADGPRYVVYLPGTDDMSPVPDAGRTARDMLTNYQLLGGRDDSYTAGVVEAMRKAGLEGQEVMLVGHSQGGMAAVAMAADPAVGADFRISHVVTAGSPTAHVADLPDGTTALHLENRGDAVPWLDGADNPDRPSRVTVRFDAGGSDVAANHGLDRYVLGAEAADRSGHASVDDALASMRRAGFLDPGAAAGPVLTYTVQRP